MTGQCSAATGGGMVPSLTLAELAPYAKTYTGKEGDYATTAPFAFVPTGPAVLVVKADGTLTYNGAAVSLFSPVCKASATSINFTFTSATLLGVVTLDASGSITGGLSPAGGGAATAQIVGTVIPTPPPAGATPLTAAQKWAAYGALFARTYTGTVDKNVNFTAVGSLAACSLTIAADGTTTYNGSNGNVKTLTPATNLPPLTNDNLNFDFPTGTASVYPGFSVSMAANTTTSVSGSGQVTGKYVWYSKSISNFGTEEYCLNLQ